MKINTKQQVSATFARNNFKEVNDRAEKEGACVIFKKSKPVTVILSFKEYEKLQKRHNPKPAKKITLEELRANSRFAQFEGTIEKTYGNIDSVKLAKKWTDYVD